MCLLFFKQKTAYEMRISDWSSDVCSSDLWKRRWIVLLGTWAVAIPGWLLVASMPSVYQSSSRIYVDTFSVLQPLLRGIAIQNDLETQVQLMQQTLLSRPNLLEVARKTDYDLSVNGDSQMEGLLGRLENRPTVT